MPIIVCLGHVCIDSNETEQRHYTSWGSAVLYMTDWFRSATSHVTTVIANHGPDFQPYKEQFNIVPEHPNQAHTLVYRNIVHDNVRTQYCKHASTATPPELTQEIRQIITEADILILAPLLPNFPPDYVSEVLSLVRPSCLTMLCPQGYLRSVGNQGKIGARSFVESDELLSRFNIVVFSDQDINYSVQTVQDWKKMAPESHIIMTQGEQGASIVSENTLEHIPTTPLAPHEIVDSVGSGDVFAAALIQEYSNSHDIRDAVLFANKAAAAKLTARK